MNKLIRSARKSARFRGHNLGNGRYLVNSQHVVSKVWQAVCKDCGAWVTCETHPAPNGIDIGGSAVAVHCTKGATV